MDRIAAVAVAVGSNLGDRAAHVQFAFRRLSSLLQHAKFSSVIETEPVGAGRAQGRFLNAAAVGETTLPAQALLAALLAIERERGRQRPFPLAPRTLDLDLILYGEQTIDSPALTVPHPRFRERAFVLVPLAEIAPDLVDPVTRTTIGQLAADLRA